MTTETPCVVVTGAASGMGKAVAERFVQEGWRVVAIDLAAGGLGSGVAPLRVDVADRAALERGLPGAVGASPLRVVVNAAGIYPPSTLADYTDEAYRRIFDVNVLGTLNVIAAAAPLLRAAGGGAIVNFASVDAFAVSPGQLLYSASKAAVVSLTRTLALELAPDGIVVNAVAPGWVDTPGNTATGRMANVARTIPLGRVADPSEIADWVWQLGRGSYVTGEMLVISGGSAIH
jgi:NAD(P)-dependent dehydrogenase (short-subunit alcohol dehydrogenase family)